MTPAKFKARMTEIASIGDCERSHEEADDLMCEALRSLGYDGGADIFENIMKWYA